MIVRDFISHDNFGMKNNIAFMCQNLTHFFELHIYKRASVHLWTTHSYPQQNDTSLCVYKMFPKQPHKNIHSYSTYIAHLWTNHFRNGDLKNIYVYICLEAWDRRTNYEDTSDMASFRRSFHILGNCPKLVAINEMDILCNKKLFLFAKHTLS